MATGIMKAVRMYAEWAPRPGFKLGPKDIEGKQTYLSSQVWKNPKLRIEEVGIPKPTGNQVLLQVKACGICGSDVHIAQTDDKGYMLYPGLTGFPVTIGHELSGIVSKAGPEARDKRTNKPFKGGEWVCTEEMIWCGSCKPCAEGYPNHCERLNEIGINVDGGFAEYVLVLDKSLWSLDPLREKYTDKDIFKLGALVEPTSVAYHAVVTRGGGIKPGDNVVILGGGPIGLAACAILKRQGAAKVILSEPEKRRAELGMTLGADVTINPLVEPLAERVLELTNGMGAKLFLEATGLATIVYPEIEKVIWEGRTLDSTVVVVARADAKIPVTGEILQVRHASILGSYGHAGHGNFPRVIESIASGMNILPLVTKEVALEQIPENVVRLQSDKAECKIQFVN